MTLMFNDVPAGNKYSLEELTKRQHSLSIGRDHDNDIPLGHGLSPSEQEDAKLKTVSSLHALIRKEIPSDDFYLSDNGSRNRTMLNDEYLKSEKEYKLNPGDRISFGPWYGPCVIYEEPNSQSSSQ